MDSTIHDFTSDDLTKLKVGDYFYITKFTGPADLSFQEPIKFVITKIKKVKPYNPKKGYKYYEFYSTDLELNIEDRVHVVYCRNYRLFRSHRVWFERERIKAARINKEYNELMDYLNGYIAHLKELKSNHPEKLI